MPRGYRTASRLAGASHFLAAALVALGLTGFAWTAAAKEHRVSNMPELQIAMSAAQAGDVILVAPGLYSVYERLRTGNAGEIERPIVVRAEKFGDVVFEVEASTAFFVNQPYWQFENLVLHGVCATHSQCDHAFHIVRHASGVIVRGNHMLDFNAHIKGNGAPDGGVFHFPSQVLIENNVLRNSSPRDTPNPVTPIDVVGGEEWVVRGNLVEDFAKGAGNKVSYGLYLKGNSRRGLIEENLVRCEVKHRGGSRFGISLGGGSTGKRYCMDQDCSHEHRKGIIRNNIVVDCPDEPGIYLNRASDTRISHNTVVNTPGILVRFETSSANLLGNLIGGRLRGRLDGKYVEAGNVIAPNDRISQWFSHSGWPPVPRKRTPVVNPRAAFREVETDYCGRVRDRRPDIGAVERTREGWCDKFAGLEWQPGD